MNPAKFECKNFASPDDQMRFDGHGQIDILKMSDGTMGMRAVFEPGWKWSVHEKPLVGTETCELPHTGVCMSGQIVVHMDSGDEFTLGPGDFFEIPSGHDAWVVGDRACELVLIQP